MGRVMPQVAAARSAVAPMRCYILGMKERLAVIGSGALGGYYGALLCRAGHEVHFLARSDAEHLRRSGLRIDSVAGDFAVEQVHAWAEADKMPRCPLVLICIKATGNGDLPRIVKHVLEPGGTLVLVQNGLGQEEALARLVGVGRVVAGLAFICAARSGPGHIVHLDYGALRLAEYAPDGHAAGVTDALARLGELLAGASIDVELDPDHLAARWKKLVWNVPFNGLSVLLRADTLALVSDPSSARLVRALMDEVVAIATREGRPTDETFVQRMISSTRRMKPYLPSMRLDFDAGRELEIEAVYREPLRRAERHGVGAPCMRGLALALEFLERARRSE